MSTELALNPAAARGLAVDHVKCFQFAPDHAEIDATLAAATWQRRYGWSLTVPRSEPVEQLELLDVRRCMSIEGASAHILYKWRGSPLSVYVINNAPAPDMRPCAVSRWVTGEDEAGRAAEIARGVGHTVSIQA